MSVSMKKLLDMNRNEPAVFNSLTDGTVYLGVANCFRGTREGSLYFKQLVEEMTYRIEHGIGVLKNGEPAAQDFRLSFVGGPCYPIFRRFDELFSARGGVFVTSSYLWFASGGTCMGYEFDLKRPLESFAEGMLIMGRQAMDSMFHQERATISDAEEFALDGIVYHPIKSCRTVSTGLADQRHLVTAKLGLPTLFLESDLMDPRVISEAQMKNRIDAYFEGLNSRKRKAMA
jgi:benzoyl-CoA reductase subunit B